MDNIIRSTTSLALLIAREYIRPGEVVIDATCGNGHDTLALAREIRRISEACQEDTNVSCSENVHKTVRGSVTKMFAFDIQPGAIDSTQARLKMEGFSDWLDDGSIALICDSHENMSFHLASRDISCRMQQVCLVLFNLGYLPGGDKNITTDSGSTLKAIESGLALLAIDGAICITMYSGHYEDAKEKARILDFARDLDSHKFHVAYISMINQPNDPPELVVISRKL